MKRQNNHYREFTTNSRDKNKYSCPPFSITKTPIMKSIYEQKFQASGHVINQSICNNRTPKKETFDFENPRSITNT